MDYSSLVEGCYACQNLPAYPPYFILVETFALFLLLLNAASQVPILSKLHDSAQT